MAEGNVGGARRQCHVNFHIVVCRHPQPQPGFANSVKIGSFQIFLTQMDAVRLVLNSQPPVVVDKQTSVVASSQRDGGDNVGLNFFIALILDAQLEGANACLQQALDPLHAVHHRIEP